MSLRPVGVLILAVALSAVFGLIAFGSDDEGVTTTTVTEQVQGPTGPTGPSGVANAAPTRREAVAVVKGFYRLLNSYRYREAWAFVPPPVRAEAGGYANWKAGYRANIRSSPSNVNVDSLSADRAVVALDLEAVDIDACTGKNVRQVFSGTWTLRAASGGWEPVDASFDKVAGGTPTLSASDCQQAPGGAGGGGPAPVDCEPGYDPCVPTYPPDVDCPDVDGPVTVTGSDPHGLDGYDNDGRGCEY